MREQAAASSSGPVTAWPVSSSERAIRLQSRPAILWMDVEAMRVEYGAGASLASPLGSSRLRLADHCDWPDLRCVRVSGDGCS